MLRFLRRGRGPLFILLFATYVGSSGCVTGSQPEANADEMESSQNEDLTNETANAEDQQDNDALVNDDSETAAPAPVAPPAPPVAQTEISTQDRGYVGGKAGSPIEEGLPETGSKMAYLVQKGDTLSKIAKRVFSNMDRWRELAVSSSVKNPNRIYPGDVIFYQLDQTTLAFAKKYESLERKLTPVRKGESLTEVSKRIYGDKDQWKFLWRHNDQINDPTHLKVGSLVYYVSPSALTSLSSLDYAKPTMNQYGITKKMFRHAKKVKA